MVFLAAKRLGCDPDTIAAYCKKHPSVQAAKDSHRGEMVDLAELKLWQSIQNGEAWGIAFALKTIGRSRGYVERSEHVLLLRDEDWAHLSDDQVQRLAAGEPAEKVVSHATVNGHTNGHTPPDPGAG